MDGDQFIVNLVDLCQAESAANALRKVVLLERSAPFRKLVLYREVQFSLAQLTSWRTELGREAMPAGGFVSVGIDERENVIQLGVLDEATREAVEAAMERLAIPEDAVELRLRDYPELD